MLDQLQIIEHSCLFFRLEAYDRNNNFSTNQLKCPLWTILRPDDTSYKDVSAASQITKISKSSIRTFLPSGQLIVPEAQSMYENRFLRYVRFCSYNGHTYIRSNCWAMMKRKVSDQKQRRFFLTHPAFFIRRN